MTPKGSDLDIDQKIIRAIEHRNTLSLRELSVPGVPHRSFIRRIRRMREQRKIRRWTVLVNPISVRLSDVVFFLAKTNPREPELLQRIQEEFVEELMGLYGITGEFSLLGRFVYKSRQDFLEKLRDFDTLMAGTRLQQYEVLEGLDNFKEYGLPRERPGRLSPNSRKVLSAIVKMGRRTELPPTTVDLANETGLSQPTVSRLLRLMKDRRAILGFSVDAELCPTSQDEMRFFLRLKVSPGQLVEVVSHLISLPEVVSLYRTGHSYPLLAEIVVEGVPAYNKLLNSIYNCQTELIDTETMLVLDQIVHRSYADHFSPKRDILSISP